MRESVKYLINLWVAKSQVRTNGATEVSTFMTANLVVIEIIFESAMNRYARRRVRSLFLPAEYLAVESDVICVLLLCQAHLRRYFTPFYACANRNRSRPEFCIACSLSMVLST